MRRPCIDCGRVTLAARCPEHTKAQEARRNASRPHYGGDWPAIRAEALQRQPWCSHCGAWNRPLEVDHVTPVAQGGESTRENAQVLCRPCHHDKSDQERRGEVVPAATAHVRRAEAAWEPVIG